MTLDQQLRDDASNRDIPVYVKHGPEKTLPWKAADHIEQLESEIAGLRKVLAWYGDGGKYDFQNTYSMTSEINKDRGQRAREALSND